MILGLVAAVIAVVGVVVFGNDYRYRLESPAIPVAGGTLEGVLTLPPNGPPRGLVVIVHGDGPVDATHDGLYLPWFEAAADAGFATVSWNKAGVGGSRGNWLHQSMTDRAAEVSAVIDWAQKQTGAEKVVLWGVSQAGWVLPAVAVARDDIDGIVAVSPAINWLRQGRFNLLAELDHEHAGPDERAQAIAVSDQTRALLTQDANYATYREKTTDPEPMDADRWDFVKRNHTADATQDLTALAATKVPVLLLLGEQDRNVDIAETATTYQRLLGAGVTTRRFDAMHSMAKPAVENSELLGFFTAVFWPRALFADGVLAVHRDFLRAR
ncbi:alpha/beta fold hydrolase [Kribbella antibiotica]|uniref:Alpha/beta fold hydrolase n=1 Tax=Kribbella antibiotica TaxID=190195 RepID=A0A4R4Z920_9ACTN|nr:alpha/beta fold hydrolase [Kribbella antibiotica]